MKTIVKLGGLCLFFAVTQTFAMQGEAAVDPATLLFQAFSSKCDSQGEFTAKALSEGGALEGILQTIMLDKSCEGLRPVLDHITSVDQQLSRVDRAFWNEDEPDMHSYEQKLALLLAGTTDPVVQASVETELANVRIDISRNSLSQARADRQAQAEAVKNLSQYISLLRNQYASQSLCFLNHPQLPFQLASHLLSLSGGFFSPVIDSALSLSGDLISDLIDLFKNQKIADSIRSYRDDRMALGIKCAAEALEDTLCQITDRRKLIEVHEKYYNGKQIPKEWLGYEILYRDYPVVQNFLLRVEAGSQSQSQLQGIRHAEFRLEEGSYRAALSQLDGMIGEAERKLKLLDTKLKSPKTDAEKQQILRNLIGSIQAVLLGNVILLNGIPVGGTSGPNVYNNVVPNPENYARLEIFLRIGTFDPPNLNLTGTVALPYNAYLTTLQVKEINIETLKTNLDEINRRAREQLALDQALVLNPDQQGTIAAWIFRTRRTIDAGSAITRIITYLGNLEKDWAAHSEWFTSPEGQRTGVSYIQTTRTKFEDVLKALKDLKQTDQEKIKTIFDTMNLEEQDEVITSRMHDIVENDLQIRLRTDLLSGQKDLENVIGLASEDVATSLFPGPIDRLEDIKMDLESAQFAAESNLDHFFHFFRDPLLKSFDLLWQSSKKWDHKYDGPQRREIAKLCILALNSTEITSKDFQPIRDWCHEQVLASVVGDKTIKVTFQEMMDRSQKDVSQRLCAYRNFRTEVDLARTLQTEKMEDAR